jgi:hypothetical protein
MFYFYNDSPNVMVKLRKECLKTLLQRFPECHGQATQGVPKDKGVRIRLWLCAPCNPQSLHGSNQELAWSEARLEANSIHGQNLEIVAFFSTII